VDYAQLIKMYGSTTVAPGRYSPAECTGIKKVRVEGNPDIANVSTSYVERQNLTMRMSMRRFTRLTNAFSKKLDNHILALALYFTFYNFCHIHKTLRISPAMAASVTDRLWSLEDVIARIDADAPAPKVRGSYKKRAARLTAPLVEGPVRSEEPWGRSGLTLQQQFETETLPSCVLPWLRLSHLIMLWLPFVQDA